jgi:hypothetical protein
MIARLLPALTLALAVCFAPSALAQDSGGSDGSDGSDEETTFDEGTSLETYDVEEQKGCSVVAGSAALAVTGLSALVVVGRRRD